MVPTCQGLKGGSLDNVSVSKALGLDQFTALKGGLVVSCQVPTGTAIDTPAFISAQAQTVVQAGAVGIRAQGVENVRAVKKLVDVPVIGLVKRYLDTSPIYIESALLAESLGCDAVATTLSGYTEIAAPELPNLDLVAKLVAKLKIPVVAEGGYHQREQVVQALKAGAWTVCVGTAITNPFLLTQHFVSGILES